MKNKEYQYEFFSPYKNYFYDYVQFKRNTGRKFERTSIFYLRMLDQLLIEKIRKDNTLKLDQELIETFCALRNNESSKSQYMRMNFIHNLSVYLNYVGVECYVFPASRFVKTHSEFTPYIFTKVEITTLINYLDHLKVAKRYPLYHIIYPMLIRLLYGCGLRISEALKLKYLDVDLENGCFFLSQTKNYSQRMIVMSDSLTNYTRSYVSNMNFSKDYSGYLLPAPDGGHYNSTAVYVTLKKHMKAVGIRRKDGTAPRVHDIRHTFSVHTLDYLVSSGADIYSVLPILSTYLGHTSICSTERYLRLTEEFFAKLTVPVEKLYADVFQEVTYEEK
ncbi:MAG: tyrosine-type recombinase/integrase [Lachnospiraceae bacterium]